MTDEIAFAGFVRAHSRSLYGTAYLLTGTQHAAEDLLQETFAALYPKWERVSAADAPVAYVRRALSNRFISSQRRAGSRDLTLWELPDSAAPGDFADLIATRRWLFASLGRLPARQRAAIVLRYFHDLDDDRIADALGARAGTVRSLISRGLATIREGSAHERTSGFPGGGLS